MRVHAVCDTPSVCLPPYDPMARGIINNYGYSSAKYHLSLPLLPTHSTYLLARHVAGLGAEVGMYVQRYRLCYLAYRQDVATRYFGRPVEAL